MKTQWFARIDGNVLPLRKKELMHPAAWGLLSAFADDDTRPLPKDQDHLLELLLMTEEAIARLEAVKTRLEIERLQ